MYFRSNAFIKLMTVWSVRGGGGEGSHLDMYTYMCLPFGVLFRGIWYSDRGFLSVTKEPKFKNLGKTGCFSIENDILMGG